MQATVGVERRRLLRKPSLTSPPNIPFSFPPNSLEPLTTDGENPTKLVHTISAYP